MPYKREVPAFGQEQVKVLCIDNHASSTHACFLLARSGYKVNSATFLSDALELMRSSSYDVYLVNDELARADEDLFEKVREAAGSTPMIFYSMIVYPFGPRLADQSGRTAETPIPVTEVGIAIARAIAPELTQPIASTCAA